MGRIEGAEGDDGSIGRPSISTNLDTWKLPETEPPTRKHTWVGLRAQEHIQQSTAWSGPSGRRCA